MDSSSEEVLTPKRSLRKRVSVDAPRAPRKVAAKAAPRKRVPRKTVSEREVFEESEEVESSTSERKAPTALASAQAIRQRRKKQTIVIGVLLVVGIIASAIVGYTDKGQIDVQKTIEARNERIRTNTTDSRDVNTSMVEVPVQNTNTTGMADGGFVGYGESVETPKPADEVASTTASSTEETVPSTEAEADEEVVTESDNIEVVPDGNSEETPTEL